MAPKRPRGSKGGPFDRLGFFRKPAPSLQGALPAAYSLSADAGAIALTGIAAALTVGFVVAAASGSIAETGQTAALKQGRVVAASSGPIALTGQPAALASGRKIGAGTGSFSESGPVTALNQNHVIAADRATLGLTGVSTALKQGRITSVSSGAIALAGQSTSPTFHPIISFGAGAVALSGQPLTLVPTGPQAVTLVADYGAFSWSGIDLDLTRSGIPFAGGGVFPPRVIRKPSTDADGFETEEAEEKAPDRLAFALPLQAGAIGVTGQAIELVADIVSPKRDAVSPPASIVPRLTPIVSQKPAIVPIRPRAAQLRLSLAVQSVDVRIRGGVSRGIVSRQAHPVVPDAPLPIQAAISIGTASFALSGDDAALSVALADSPPANDDADIDDTVVAIAALLLLEGP